MSTRICSAALLIATAACDRASPAAVAPAEAVAARIDCALAAGAPLVKTCTVERSGDGDGQLLVVHHPDGRFRRLRLVDDGRGVAAADGAEPAVVTIRDPATIDVAIGAVRYRLPATIGTMRQ